MSLDLISFYPQLCAPGVNSSLDEGMGACKKVFFAILKVPFAAAYCQTPRRVVLRRKRHLSDEQGPMERRPPAKRMLQTTIHGTTGSSYQEALGKLHQFSDSTKVTCHDL